MSQVMEDMYALGDLRSKHAKGAIIKYPAMSATAWFDEEEVYRYIVTYQWAPDRPTMVGIFLNPSTATHLKLDPTIDGMIHRAMAWGYGSYTQINAFAFRATNPKDMLKATDPVGPVNDAAIRGVLRRARREKAHIVAGWGPNGCHMGRDKQVMELIAEARTPLYALKVNKDGSPGHPLYIARDVRPAIYYEWAPTIRRRDRPVATGCKT